MKKNEVLKKHHFWILFGIVPLLVLISVIVVSSSVGSEISSRLDTIKAKESAVKAKSNPKPNVLLEKMGDMISVVNSKQDVLWRSSYEPQKALFTMLDSPKLKDLEALKLRFGDKIPDAQDEFEDFKKQEYYIKRFKDMAEKPSPSPFRGGGWPMVLRHVNQWSDVRLTSSQVWLLLEDIWVQESLLDGIATVNAQMAEYERVKFERNGQVIDDPADAARQDPLRRKFKSRVWEVELEVAKEGTKSFLKCTLINATDKVQLMGLANTMTLNVWLERGDKKNIQPFVFKIGGEFLPGVGSVRKDREGRVLLDKDGKPLPGNVLEVPRSVEDHVLPAGMNVAEIARVEQVFDTRTVPVREIREVALGVTDSHLGSDFQLKMPLFKDFQAEAAEAAVQPTSGPGGKPGGPSTTGMPGPGGGPGGAQQATGRTVSGGGTVQSVVDANKKRYIEVTEQVRRMPIALTVVVDQSYLQDVLLAMANSPLRFQTTQVRWNRFRDVLESSREQGQLASSRPGESGGGVVRSGQTQFGGEFGQAGKRPGMMSGSGLSPEGGIGGMRPPGPGGMSGFGGVPFSGYGGFSPGSVTVSESQLTSGLIELNVYGVVSLYSSPDAPPAAAKQPDAKQPDAKQPDAKQPDAKQPDAKDKGKKVDARTTQSKEQDSKGPESKEPMPKTPMNPQPETPKKRTRRGSRSRSVNC